MARQDASRPISGRLHHSYTMTFPAIVCWAAKFGDEGMKDELSGALLWR